MKIASFLRGIKKSITYYTPLIEIRISRERLLANLHAYQEAYPDILFAPVLKSNAYGHGFLQIARILDREKIAFFVVDSLFEAMAMRGEGIYSPILVIGYVSPRNIAACRLRNVAFTITDVEQLRALAPILKKRKQFHLKVDTGMHRQGIAPYQLQEALAIAAASPAISLAGLCSHLADADNKDDTFTKEQLHVWDDIVAYGKQHVPSIRYYHAVATAGLTHRKSAQGNVARLGIGLYGIAVGDSLVKKGIRPVLEFRSIVTSVKEIPRGDSIGYGATYQAKKDMVVATVPTGYAEGVDRRLSNEGYFKIGDVFCPIVGRVSMNITSIDVSGVSGVRVGDEVVVISNDARDKNSVRNIADTIGVIPYEVLVHIQQYLRRTVV